MAKGTNQPILNCNIFPKLGRVFLTSLVLDSLSDFASFVTSGSNVGIMQLGPVEQQLARWTSYSKANQFGKWPVHIAWAKHVDQNANIIIIITLGSSLILSRFYLVPQMQSSSKPEWNTRSGLPPKLEITRFKSWRTPLLEYPKTKKRLAWIIPYELPNRVFFRGTTPYHKYNDAAKLGAHTPWWWPSQTSDTVCQPKESIIPYIHQPGLFLCSFLRL